MSNVVLRNSFSTSVLNANAAGFATTNMHTSVLGNRWLANALASYDGVNGSGGWSATDFTVTLLLK